MDMVSGTATPPAGSMVVKLTATETDDGQNGLVDYTLMCLAVLEGTDACRSQASRIDPATGMIYVNTALFSRSLWRYNLEIKLSALVRLLG